MLYLKLVLRCFAEWLAALALWLCFTFSISAVELLVGAVSAALTDVALETTFRAVPFCFQPRLGMLALARVPSVYVSLALALLSLPERGWYSRDSWSAGCDGVRRPAGYLVGDWRARLCALVIGLLVTRDVFDQI